MMSRIPPGNTLLPTALVLEAYLRLVGDRDPGWDGRGHFFGSAARAMRRILVEQAQRKSAIKHGGGRERVDVDEFPIRVEGPDTDMLALDEALEELERADPRAAQVIHLRYFAGLSTEETADTMGLSVSTVEREWRYARTLLHFRLTEGVSE